MKALNWFQAVSLAHIERRAIRREGWEKWLFRRFYVWLVHEIIAGVETLRVARNTDFQHGEFLAKDWTDEPWEGATTPPCTTLGPAEKIPGNASGGAGVWTIDERCGGNGEGGNVPPILIDPDLVELDAQIVIADGANDPLAPDGGGGTCWTGSIPAESMFVMVRLGPGIPPSEAGGDYQVYLSETGDSLSGPLEWGETISGVTRQLTGPTGGGPGDMAAYFDATWDGFAWPNFAPPSTNNDPIALTPGDTITARVEYRSPAGNIYTLLVELELAPAC